MWNVIYKYYGKDVLKEDYFKDDYFKDDYFQHKSHAIWKSSCDKLYELYMTEDSSCTW